MSDQKKIGIDIGPGAKDIIISDSIIQGSDIPIRAAKNTRTTIRNVHAVGNTPRQTFRALSIGYSGGEQFDPKQEAKKHDLFYGPKLLLTEGAYKNLVEFDSLAFAFFADKPYARVAEIDAEMGNLVHKIKLIAEPPDRLQYTAYAVVNDLRNALDQAVSASSSAINKYPAKNAYFPFAENPTDLDGILRSPRYSDIPDSLKPFLRSLQPYPTSNAYKGGNDLLRAFAKLANPNKHQIPLRIDARPLEGVYAIKNIYATEPLDIFDPYWDSAKNEIVVARTGATGTCHYNLTMPFYVAFADTGFLSGYPISATLSEIMSEVDGIILGIEAETSRLLVT